MPRTRSLILVIALSLIGVSSWAPPVGATGMHSMETRLDGSAAYPRATGHADYCCHRDLDLDLRHVRSLAGKTLVVYANGHKVGTSTVTTAGRMHFHRHGSGVPRMRAGDVIGVKRSSGTLVASGKFRRMCCM